MSVLAEIFSVIIRVSTVENRFPGGFVEYYQQCPYNTYCTDNEICRVGFMHRAHSHFAAA